MTTINIDCSAPLADQFFELQDFVEYLTKMMKVAGLRNNLNGKLTIEGDAKDKRIVVRAESKYSKRACRYYARKFLKKNNLRERFRVVASAKDTYELRPYRVSSNE